MPCDIGYWLFIFLRILIVFLQSRSYIGFVSYVLWLHCLIGWFDCFSYFTVEKKWNLFIWVLYFLFLSLQFFICLYAFVPFVPFTLCWVTLCIWFSTWLQNIENIFWKHPIHSYPKHLISSSPWFQIHSNKKCALKNHQTFKMGPTIYNYLNLWFRYFFLHNTRWKRQPIVIGT